VMSAECRVQNERQVSRVSIHHSSFCIPHYELER